MLTEWHDWIFWFWYLGLNRMWVFTLLALWNPSQRCSRFLDWRPFMFYFWPLCASVRESPSLKLMKEAEADFFLPKYAISDDLCMLVLLISQPPTPPPTPAPTAVSCCINTDLDTCPCTQRMLSLMMRMVYADGTHTAVWQWCMYTPDDLDRVCGWLECVLLPPSHIPSSYAIRWFLLFFWRCHAFVMCSNFFSGVHSTVQERKFLS